MSKYSNKFHALKKFKECQFFIKKLRFEKERDDEWGYYYSAFLAAWRSVLDVLLYDASVRFNLGFSRDDHLVDWKFSWAANKENNESALKFFTWWKQARSSLQKFSIWNKRNVLLHRGYPEKGSVFVHLSTSSGITTLSSGYNSNSEISIINDKGVETRVTSDMHMFTDDHQECVSALSEMRKIVYEAIELLK